MINRFFSPADEQDESAGCFSSDSIEEIACRSFSPISSSPAAHVEASGEGIAALEEYPGRQLDNRDAKTPGSRRTMSLLHEIE